MLQLKSLEAETDRRMSRRNGFPDSTSMKRRPWPNLSTLSFGLLDVIFRSMKTISATRIIAQIGWQRSKMNTPV